MKVVRDKYLKRTFLALVVFVCVLLFWGSVVKRSLLDVEAVVLFFGAYILGIVVVVVFLKLFYLSWNYVNLVFSRSKGEYSNKIPNIHPATASVISNAGAHSMKRILSSSLLRLVCLDVISIEKHESNVIVSSKNSRKKNVELTKIDKAVLELATDYFGPGSKGGDKESKENKKAVSKEYVRNLTETINDDLEKYENYLLVPFTLVGASCLIYIVPVGAGSILLTSLFEHSSSFVPDGVSGFVSISLQAFYILHIAIAAIFGRDILIPDYVNRNAALSRTGIAAWNELRALKRWLEDYTLLEEKDAFSVEAWEEYMVYAAALGVPPSTYRNFTQLTAAANEIVYSAVEQYFDD